MPSAKSEFPFNPLSAFEGRGAKTMDETSDEALEMCAERVNLNPLGTSNGKVRFAGVTDCCRPIGAGDNKGKRVVSTCVWSSMTMSWSGTG